MYEGKVDDVYSKLFREEGHMALEKCIIRMDLFSSESSLMELPMDKDISSNLMDPIIMEDLKIIWLMITTVFIGHQSSIIKDQLLEM